MTRVAIVNDLALAVETLRRAVSMAPGHDVAWIAKDGFEAVEKYRKDRPDLVLMDLIMPGMNGVVCTQKLMALAPCPILVVTANMTGNYQLVFEAMSAGALDAVGTPQMAPDGTLSGTTAFLEKLNRVAGMGRRPQAASPDPARRVVTATDPLPPLIILGASTGGPRAIADVLKDFPATLPAAVIIVQHVDAHFAPGLASWLSDESKFPVSVIAPGDRPKIGEALVASTGDHLVLTSLRALRYTREPADYPYRPSVDVFMRSAAAYWPRPSVAALLTGMGADGARGLLALREAGWKTIAQDQATSVVYGMPRAAAELNAASQVLPITSIGPVIVKLVSDQVRR